MDQDEDLVAIERAMLAIRRRQGKRSLRDAVPADHFDPATLAWIPAMEAIEELEPRATVTSVAALIGADASRISRVISNTVAAGFVERSAAQSDGRSALLFLTPAGSTFVTYAHRYRQDSIARATATWSRAERRQFVTLLTRFTDALNDD